MKEPKPAQSFDEFPEHLRGALDAVRRVLQARHPEYVVVIRPRPATPSKEED